MTAAFERSGPEGLVVKPWPAPAPDPSILLGWRADRAVVLRSGPGDPRLSRWSYAALEPRAQVRTLAEARRALQGWAVPRRRDLPEFLGGAIGYIGYDVGWAHQSRPRVPRADPMGMPSSSFGIYDAIYARDESTGQGWLLAQDTDEARARLRTLESALTRAPAVASGGLEASLHPLVSRDRHEARVREILELIAAGEVYQVNLTYPLAGRYRGAPEAAFGRLVADAPPPYAAYLGLGPGRALVSASPECFMHFDAWTGELATYPIKGTRRRSADPTEDRRLAAELIADPKERAEHMMIVDLLRNDLGRLARPGDVRVDRLAYLESFATVHHLTSRVVARLPPPTSDEALLAALFPGGSITGAPKLRAMELIDALEDAPRGAYTGTIGCLGPDGNMMTSIAIRTAQLCDGEVRFGVGGGIVADSDPGREWEETRVKAQALTRALTDR